jgi:CBS domain-containing protein
MKKNIRTSRNTRTTRRTATAPTRATGRTDRQPFLDLPVDRVMSKDVLTVSTSTPISEVERTLAEAHVGGVPVTDAAGQVVGVLSLHDIADRYSSDPDSRPRRHTFYSLVVESAEEDELEGYEVPSDAEDTAADVMSAQVFSVPRTATLRQVAREMRRRQVHRLLVQDRGKMAGIVSTTDLLRAMAR